MWLPIRRIPSVVNLTFSTNRPRDTNEMVCAMKKAGVFSILFVAVLLAVAVTAEAQQPAKVPRIGYLTNESLSALSARTEAFRQGLANGGKKHCH
jgi:hypothetical protein